VADTEVAVSAVIVIEVPFLTLMDGLETSAAGRSAGVDERGDGGAAALVC
jgi:hypothetical protein